MSVEFRYDRATILLHWMTAALIAAGWLLGQIIDVFGRAGEPPIRSMHILLGLVLIPVLLGRVALRLTGRSRPPSEPGIAAASARVVHIVLYVLVFAAIAFGIGNAWMRGSDVFGWFRFAAMPNPDRVLRRSVNEWHEVAANAVLIVALLHAGAALLHHYVLRDGVLRRMLPVR